MTVKFGAYAGVLALCMLSACGVFDSAPKPRTGVVPGETITVNGSQNVYAIAQEHGVSMRDIILLNNLHEPFAVKSGQTLVLPFKRGDSASGGMDSGVADAGGTMQAAPLPAIQSESLPAPIQSTALAPVATATAPAPQVLGKTKPSAPLTAVDALNTATPPKQQVATTMTPPPAPVAAPAVTETSDSSSPPSMIWPVQGPLLSGFGPKGQGVNNDGANIGAPKGSPVVAAANGIVVYAGNEMKGFGNLVLIRHEGGWVTAYAYLDRMLVAKDAVVAQGDMIGTVGKTGNVASPQLHFETRHNGKAVDPNGVVKQ